MLRQLFIQNYAIIEKLRIDFTGHLNVITGETGAGKSILMGALGLILGDRADTSSLLEQDKKCVVEGIFSRPGSREEDFLLTNDLDTEGEIILRREISSTGKSRAFINDTPVTLTQLRGLAEFLVDLHRQFDTAELMNRNFQLEVIDTFADHEELINDYKQDFKKYKSLKEQLIRLKTEQEEANRERDYHQFLFDELEQADFSENEIEELEAELRLINNSENIKTNLLSIVSTFQEGEFPLLQQLKSALSKVGEITGLIPRLADVEQRLRSAYIELKDIAAEIESADSDISFSEERMNEVNERLDIAYTLCKKHHVTATADLLKVKEHLGAQLQKTQDLSDTIEVLAAEEKELFTKLMQHAKQISEERKSQTTGFARKVNELLKQVGMPNAAFKVEIRRREVPDENGIDQIFFLFNANKTTFQPLEKVASGGELSRLMLIIKSLVAENINLPTLIFDEIDSGISGEAARQVGNIIKQLSADHQILLITHQPQIAAKAYTHFHVFKESRDGRILTGIRILNDEERIRAIATMLSGDDPTKAAFENAREMMR